MSKKRFRFANWNAHSVINKRQEIEAMFSLHDLDMLCVTETWLTPDFVFEFFGYMTFRCDRRLGRGGGALILIRSALAVTKIDLPIPYEDAFEAVGLSVRTSLGVMAIVCAYMPPNSGAELLAWRSLFAFVLAGSAILFCGDFNAHSGHWGSPCTNAAGRLISGLVSNLDLIPLNDSSPTFLLALECCATTWIWFSYRLLFPILHRLMLVMTLSGLIIFRSSVCLTRLCSASALLVGATTLRVSIGLVSVLAATNFHGIISLGSSWWMIPDPSRRVSSKASTLLWRPAARTTTPACAVIEKLSPFGGTSSVIRLLLREDRPLRFTCATKLGWGKLLFAM